MCVVEAWVPRFDRVERAVECGGFDAHFAHEVFGEVGGEAWGVVGCGVWEEGVVYEDGYGVFAVHDGVGFGFG